MKKSKSQIFILIFSLTYIFLLFGCLKDDSVIFENNTSNKIILQHISLNEIENNRIIYENLEEVRNTILEISNSSSRTEYNEENDFYIDTEDVIYIEQGNYHSYTFYVYRDLNNTYLENLSLSLQHDGTYTPKLFTYPKDINGEMIIEDVQITTINGINSSNLLSRSDPYCQGGWAVGSIDWIDTDGNLYYNQEDCYNASSETCNPIVNWIKCDDNPNIDPDGSNGGDADGNDGSDNSGEDSNNNNDSDGSGDYNNPDGNEGDGNSGGGGSSGDNTNTDNEDENSNDDNINNEETCIQDENGECIEEMTSPILPKVDQKNCEELKKLGTTQDIFQSYQELQSSVNLFNEVGYSYEIGEAPTPLEQLTQTKLKMTTGGKRNGISHTHPPKNSANEKVFPMFSVEDIVILGKLREEYFNPGSNPYDSSFFFTLTVKNEENPAEIGPTETYALKINNWGVLFQFIDSYKNLNKKDKERFGEILQEKYTYIHEYQNAGNVSKNYLKTLFKFLSDQNINGLDIYKAKNQSLDDWEKLNYEITNNDTVNLLPPTDCQY